MSSPTNEKSGKFLILAVLALGVIAALASWSFRYEATHKAVELWGPQAALLIRDAPHVTLRSDTASTDAAGTTEADVPRDISQAQGLTHLRNALLQDSNFEWDTQATPATNWDSSLVFAAAAGAEPRAVVLFSSDYKWLANGSSGDPTKHVVATSAELQQGLQKFFAEAAAAAPAE